MNKTCLDCSESKPITMFYKHEGMSDGYLNKCKACVKSRVGKHRKENIESVRQYDRDRSRERDRKKFLAENSVRFRKLNPIKYKAHIALNNAIRDGKIKKENCVVCGSKRSHGHHDDYNKPLDVIWLCAIHHSERHKQMKKIV